MEYYITKLNFIVLVNNNKPKKKNLNNGVVFILKARSRGEAFKKALKLGKEKNEAIYSNGKNKVACRLTEICTIDKIGGETENIEVASRLYDKTEDKPVTFRTKFYPENSNPIESLGN